MTYNDFVVYHFLFSFWLKTIKNELKRRQSMWNSVHWELVEPAVSIRTLRARMVSYFCLTVYLFQSSIDELTYCGMCGVHAKFLNFNIISLINLYLLYYAFLIGYSWNAVCFADWPR